MSLSDRYLIGCCLNNEEYRNKYKKVIRIEKIIDDRLRHIAIFLKEDTFSFELLHSQCERRTLLLAMELANWSAQNEINNRNDKELRGKTQ